MSNRDYGKEARELLNERKSIAHLLPIDSEQFDYYGNEMHKAAEEEFFEHIYHEIMEARGNINDGVLDLISSGIAETSRIDCLDFIWNASDYLRYGGESPLGQHLVDMADSYPGHETLNKPDLINIIKAYDKVITESWPEEGKNYTLLDSNLNPEHWGKPLNIGYNMIHSLACENSRKANDGELKGPLSYKEAAKQLLELEPNELEEHIIREMKILEEKGEVVQDCSQYNRLNFTLVMEYLEKVEETWRN